jgi:hypothetical protein
MCNSFESCNRGLCNSDHLPLLPAQREVQARIDAEGAGFWQHTYHMNMNYPLMVGIGEPCSWCGATQDIAPDVGYCEWCGLLSHHLKEGECPDCYPKVPTRGCSSADEALGAEADVSHVFPAVANG